MQASYDSAAEFRERLAIKIKTIRQEKALTTLKMAYLTDTQQSTISKLERGENTLFEIYHRVISNLGITTADISGENLYPVQPLPDPPDRALLEAAENILTDAAGLTENLQPLSSHLANLAKLLCVDPLEADISLPALSPLVTLGERVRALREERGLTQVELASLTNMSRRTLHVIENGVRNPSMDTVIRLGEALMVSLPEFLPDNHDDNSRIAVSVKLSKLRELACTPPILNGITRLLESFTTKH